MQDQLGIRTVTRAQKPSPALVCMDSENLARLSAERSSREIIDLLSDAHIACSSAYAIDLFASDPSISCAFVLSCDDVPLLDVARALKGRCPWKKVFAVSDDQSSWFMDRCLRLGVDECITFQRFLTLLEQCAQASAPPFSIAASLSSVDDASTAPSCEDEVLAYARSAVLPYAGDCVEDEWEPDFAPSLFGLRAAFDQAFPIEDVSVPAIVPELAPAPAPMPEPVAAVASVPAVAPALSVEPAVSNKSHQAFYVPVVGATGGSGRSAIAWLGAACSAHMGCRTLLIDFDVQYGDMELFSRNETVVHADELLEDPQLVDDLKPGPDGFALLAACAALEKSEHVAASLEQLYDLVAPRFDVVISNSGCFWTEQSIALLERAGKVLFVLDQRSSAIRAAQQAFDLCLQCGLAASPFTFLLNRCNRQSRMSSFDVSCALKGAPCVELPDGGRLVDECLSAKRGDALFDDENALAMAVHDVMLDILPGCSVLKGIKKERKSPFSFLSSLKRGSGDVFS